MSKYGTKRLFAALLSVCMFFGATAPVMAQAQELDEAAVVPQETVVEASLPEESVPELTETEATVSETTQEETTEPEKTEGETTVPQETEQETTVPQETEEETTVPEEVEAETTAPETTVPEETVPEVIVSEVTVTDSELAAVKESEELSVTEYADFVANLKVLEGYADSFAATSAKDASELILNFIRTGVERYNESLWPQLAGQEITAFVNYVAAQDAAKGTTAMALRNIELFTLPNGNVVDFGHMFGTLNIAYVNVQASADLGGWAGDICDLMYYSAFRGNVPEGTVEEMAAFIKANCFGIDADDAFGMDDFYGDMDAFYLINMIKEGKQLSTTMEAYFTEELNDSDRAAYFMNNRFKGLETHEDVRNAVYDAYIGNIGMQVLEADRGITDFNDLRTACCYAFADYVFELGGDRLEGDTGEGEEPEEPDQPDEPVDDRLYKPFSTTKSTLAPGITQEVSYALTKDGKQIVYYIGTIDANRDDIQVYANYRNNDPSDGWGMQRVTDQMNAAKAKHSDPSNTETYIANYTPIVGINADFYNMSNGQPSGALVMEGVTYNKANGKNFFAVLKDGTPIIATGSEWNTYASQVQEAVSGSTILVRNGEPVVGSGTYYTERGPRSCVGITADGKVLFVVLDGRQEPFSAGATQEEVAQIMVDAGCVVALHLDGGGSATYASKPEGSDSVRVISSPSDGYERSVSSSLMAVSTAVISNEFAYAAISSEYDYLTINTSLQMSAVGVSASGNAAQLPENAVWQVSDETIGEITEDGVFTAIENGEVEVQLVADGMVVGKKTLNVVLPDKIAFEEDTINAIYGVEIDLPVVASYKGNPVAFNLDDIWVYPADDYAAYVEGITFIGDEEYGKRTVEVWVELNEDWENVNDTMIVNLFKADEAVFDFDNATAGNRQLAWEREITNSTTVDGLTYQITDPDKGMDVTYTFALDMTEIDIPEKLRDIVYMLPGGDQVDATAWDFLMQLAERVSVLTEVKVSAQFDANLDVDVSELKVVNDYFYLKKAELDESTNTVSLTCGWVDQTQALDPDACNPICILSGIKAVPKAGASWDSEDQLNVVNAGEVTYNIFLRANALYNFAVKEENQKIYGLVPFDNPDVQVNGANERGASFGDTYTTFADTFILDKTNRQGWVQVDNHLYYFIDNVALGEGIRLLPGYEDAANKYYYSFAADGSCDGTVTGLFELSDGLHYAINGTPRLGWQTVTVDGETKYYYFDRTTGVAVDGQQTIDGYTYTFTDHILTRGQIVKNDRGYRYRWAGKWATSGWTTIDGEIYYCQHSEYLLTGRAKKYAPNGEVWYCLFAEDGRWMRELSGFYDDPDGYTYYIENGFVIEWPGVVIVDDEYYYFNSLGRMVKNGTFWISKGNGLLKEKAYTFDADGKIIFDEGEKPGEVPPVEELKNGIVEENGELYYYVNGVRTYAGVIKIDGDYYYVNSSYKVIRDCKYWISKTNGLLPEKSYTFDKDGKMSVKDGLCNVDGELRLYQIEKWLSTYNGLYTDKNGETYYIVNGVADLNAGLVRIVQESGEVNYYYFCNNTVCNLQSCAHNGTAVKNGIHWVADHNDLLPAYDYTFDANGVIAHHADTSRNGIHADENGVDCYYIDGVKAYMGLVKIGEDYYYIRSSGEVAKNTSYWISKTNGIVPEGKYEIDENGIVIFGDVTPGEQPEDKPDDKPEEVKNGIVEENGELYYYKDGKLHYAGLIEIDGHYYYVNSSFKVIHSKKYWITKTNGLLPEKSYTFDETGKIVLEGTDKPQEPIVPDTPVVPDEPEEVKNGIVQENGDLYYYKNGKLFYAGLIEIDGDYYYVNTSCKVIHGRDYWISKTNGLLDEKSYTFDETGKIVFKGTDKPQEPSEPDTPDAPDTPVTPDEPEEVKNGIVEENGDLYYYKDGKLYYAGLIEIDGHYYYVNSSYKVIHGKKYWISKTNGLLPETSYTFDAQGRIVLE